LECERALIDRFKYCLEAIRDQPIIVILFEVAGWEFTLSLTDNKARDFWIGRKAAPPFGRAKIREAGQQ